MPSKIFDDLINELIEKFGDQPFFTVQELVSIGIFGTGQSAKDTLDKGKLPYIKISERRSVVPRACLIEFLKKNFVEKK